MRKAVRGRFLRKTWHPVWISVRLIWTKRSGWNVIQDQPVELSLLHSAVIFQNLATLSFLTWTEATGDDHMASGGSACGMDRP